MFIFLIKMFKSMAGGIKKKIVLVNLITTIKFMHKKKIKMHNN